eukprot:Rmarinus@m.6150
MSTRVVRPNSTNVRGRGATTSARGATTSARGLSSRGGLAGSSRGSFSRGMVRGASTNRTSTSGRISKGISGPRSSTSSIARPRTGSASSSSSMNQKEKPVPASQGARQRIDSSDDNTHSSVDDSSSRPASAEAAGEDVALRHSAGTVVGNVSGAVYEESSDESDASSGGGKVSAVGDNLNATAGSDSDSGSSGEVEVFSTVKSGVSGPPRVSVVTLEQEKAAWAKLEPSASAAPGPHSLANGTGPSLKTFDSGTPVLGRHTPSPPPRMLASRTPSPGLSARTDTADEFDDGEFDEVWNQLNSSAVPEGDKATRNYLILASISEFVPQKSEVVSPTWDVNGSDSGNTAAIEEDTSVDKDEPSSEENALSFLKVNLTDVKKIATAVPEEPDTSQEKPSLPPPEVEPLQGQMAIDTIQEEEEGEMTPSPGRKRAYSHSSSASDHCAASDAVCDDASESCLKAEATTAIPESAEEEWDKISRLRQEEDRKLQREEGKINVRQGWGAAVTYETAYKALKDNDVAAGPHYPDIVVEDRTGPLRFCFCCGGPSIKGGALREERDVFFRLALVAYSDEEMVHFNMLQTVWMRLTGDKRNCPRFGGHWEQIGFQGNDPSKDFRGAGILGLLQLVFFVVKHADVARKIWRLSNDEVQNFPFCVVGLNLTRITLEALRECRSTRVCNRRGSVFAVCNDLYAAVYHEMFRIWKSEKKTIVDFGEVLLRLSKSAKKNPTKLISAFERDVRESKAVATDGEGLKFSPMDDN